MSQTRHEEIQAFHKAQLTEGIDLLERYTTALRALEPRVAEDYRARQDAGQLAGRVRTIVEQITRSVEGLAE